MLIKKIDNKDHKNDTELSTALVNAVRMHEPISIEYVKMLIILKRV